MVTTDRDYSSYEGTGLRHDGSHGTPDKKPFTFQRNEDGSLSLSEAAGQAVGRASVCWSEVPQGVFDEASAREVVQALLAYIHDRDQELLEGFAEWTVAALWKSAPPTDERIIQQLVNDYLETRIKEYK